MLYKAKEGEGGVEGAHTRQLLFESNQPWDCRVLSLITLQKIRIEHPISLKYMMINHQQQQKTHAYYSVSSDLSHSGLYKCLLTWKIKKKHQINYRIIKIAFIIQSYILYIYIDWAL